MDANRARDRRHTNALALQNARRQEAMQRRRIPTVSDIPFMVGLLNSDDHNSQLCALLRFNNLLLIEDPPIQQVVEAGVVPRFVQFLLMDQSSDLQIEATRVLAVISTDMSENVQLVMSQLASEFVRLVSTNENVCEEAVKALANITSYSSPCRDLLLDSLEWIQFVSELNEHSKVSLLKNAIDIVANLCERWRVTSLDKLKPGILLFERLYFHSSNEEVSKKLCATFCRLFGAHYMSNHDDIPYLLKLIKRDDFPALQFEVAWRLSDIGVGTLSQTQFLADHGVVPVFARTLGSHSQRTRHEAALCLVRLIEKSGSCRELVLKSGAFASLLNHLNSNSQYRPAHLFSNSMLRKVTYTLSTLCRGRPPFEQVESVVPELVRTLVNSGDEEVLSYVGSALFFLSEYHYERVQAEIEAVFYRLLQLLGHSRWVVRDSCLGIVGNILSRQPSQSQVTSSAFPVISRMMVEDEMNSIRRKACLILSNISFRDRGLIQAVIDEGLIGSILKLLQSDKHKEACELLNVICHGSNEQLSYIVGENCIGPLCDLLSSSDSRTTLLCLEGLDLILKAGSDGDGYVQLIRDANGIKKVKELRNHDNDQISVKAKEILETYLLE